MATPAPDLIADIEAALRRMFPAPWEYLHAGPKCEEPHTVMGSTNGDGSCTSIVHTSWDRPGEADNMRGIVTLRNRVPELLALLRQAVDVVRPFAVAADGVPDTWPGFVVLVWNDDRKGRMYMNYLSAETDAGAAPKIDDYRNAAAWLAAVEGGAK